MIAFEAFSSDLEAGPLRGTGSGAPKNFEKNAMSAFETFSSDLGAGTWSWSVGGAPGKF